MLSVVILNWKRPENVRFIVYLLRKIRFVDDITIWNNNPDTQLGHSKGCRTLNATVDFGLETRFAAAAMAKQDAVLIIDDDVLIQERALWKLFQQWRQNPEYLHGKFGRAPRPDNTYADAVYGEGKRCPIMLTRLMIMHRYFALEYFKIPNVIREKLAKAAPSGNGEDIVMSFVASWSAGTKGGHFTHDIETTELPSPHAIHHSKGHQKHRTEVMNLCQQLMA